MISICIPVYNYDVVKLVNDLRKQTGQSKFTYEILVLEDGSTNKNTLLANSQLKNGDGINYMVETENRGRNKVRQALAALAQFPNLLFLDADSGLIDDQFLVRYEQQVEQFDVVSGGRKYEELPSIPTALQLHYLYGKKREENFYKGRNIFLSCNFLIKKDLFLELHFDEHLVGYGHEDTYMFLQLLKNGYRIKFINNPVHHLQLIRENEFMANQVQALKNLYYLHKTYQHELDFDQIRLVQVYQKLQKRKTGRLLMKALSRWQHFFLTQLKKTKRLMYLDLWKLSYFSLLHQEASPLR